MYSNAIILKDLTLKIVRGAFMYHEVTAYDRIIAYARLSFLVIDMKAMINYLDARKFRNAKRYFNIMSHSLHASVCIIL